MIEREKNRHRPSSSRQWLPEHCDCVQGASTVAIAVDGAIVATVQVADVLRPDAVATVAALKKMGIRALLLSGALCAALMVAHDRSVLLHAAPISLHVARLPCPRAHPSVPPCSDAKRCSVSLSLSACHMICACLLCLAHFGLPAVAIRWLKWHVGAPLSTR